MKPFLIKKVFYINPANFIQGSNKAIDNTVLILILLKLISKVTKVINKVMPDARCRGNGKLRSYTVQKMKFSIKEFFSKCDEIRIKLRIWSHSLKDVLNGKLHFLCKYIG